MPAPLSQALKYVHRINERNKLAERNYKHGLRLPEQMAAQRKQDIQPDVEHLMGLFERMREQYTKAINERAAKNQMMYNAQGKYVGGIIPNPSPVSKRCAWTVTGTDLSSSCQTMKLCLTGHQASPIQ